MKNKILKLNHIIFYWYYSRCGDHFMQWTFFKSVKLLVANYYHLELMYNIRGESLSEYGKEINELRKENSNLRIQQIATDGQIRWANQHFGMNWTPPTEN